MGNTSIANVLAIAPELTDFLTDQAQSTQVTIATVTDSATYTTTINSTAFTYDTSASATALEVASGMTTAINAGAEPVDVTNNGDGTYTITATAAGTAYTLELDSNQTSLVLQANVDRSSMIALVLADVARRVTAGAYGTFQEEAQRYLAAHLFTSIMDAYNAGSGGGGAIKKERAGDHEREYMEISSRFEGFNRYDTTKYGQVYNAISKGAISAPRYFV